jgi:ectoine hydroxylase-related dioxygenase (phytanoyl-CoA dioxygenase family)
VLSANKCTLRRVSPDTVGGWHQDGAFLGRGIRAVNLWLALSDCGTDAPGMDLVPRRLDDVVETGGPDAYFDWAAGDAAVERAAGTAGIVRPEFRAGDVLIFDDLMLHRTATEPTMTADRRAIELWSFSAAAYPDGHIQLVW